MRIRPTKPELQLQTILNESYPNIWDYTGDGGMIIGGKIPDFSNVNGRKAVIEMFGDYWHKGQEPQDKIAHYEAYGFECLVIWEHELEDYDTFLTKIEAFGGC